MLGVLQFADIEDAYEKNLLQRMSIRIQKHCEYGHLSRATGAEGKAINKKQGVKEDGAPQT